MSEQETYYTVKYYDPLRTAPQYTLVKAETKEDAERKFKRENPNVILLEAWSE